MTFLTEIWCHGRICRPANCHRRCKQEVQDQEKEWWRPSLISRPSTRGSRITSRCHSQPTQPPQPSLPEGLPKEILSRPDVMYRMLTHKKTGAHHDKKDTCSTNKVSGSKRPYTAPSSKPIASAMKKKASIVFSEEEDPLSPWRASPDIMANTRSAPPSKTQYCTSILNKHECGVLRYEKEFLLFLFLKYELT